MKCDKLALSGTEGVADIGYFCGFAKKYYKKKLYEVYDSFTNVEIEYEDGKINNLLEFNTNRVPENFSHIKQITFTSKETYDFESNNFLFDGISFVALYQI